MVQLIKEVLVNEMNKSRLNGKRWMDAVAQDIEKHKFGRGIQQG